MPSEGYFFRLGWSPNRFSTIFSSVHKNRFHTLATFQDLLNDKFRLFFLSPYSSCIRREMFFFRSITVNLELSGLKFKYMTTFLQIDIFHTFMQQQHVGILVMKRICWFISMIENLLGKMCVEGALMNKSCNFALML